MKVPLAQPVGEWVVQATPERPKQFGVPVGPPQQRQSRNRRYCVNVNDAA
jgi:hypothetical protein